MLLQAPYDPNDHTDKHDSSDQSVSKHCRLPENKIFEFNIPISHFAPLVFTTDVQFGTQSEQFVEGREAPSVFPRSSRQSRPINRECASEKVCRSAQMLATTPSTMRALTAKSRPEQRAVED